jgi:hypothetical protein
MGGLGWTGLGVGDTFMGLKNQEKRFSAVSSAQGHQGKDTPTQEGKLLTLLRQVIWGSD